MAVVARLHRRALPVGFFAQLGTPFLTAYHRGFVDGPDGLAIVAEGEDGVVGFVVGAARARRHSRWMVRHRGIVLALAGIVGMLRRPSVLARFLRTRLGRYLRGLWRRLAPGHVAAEPGRSQPGADDVAVLHHVAVDPRARGDGAGAALVAEFVNELRARQVSDVRLVTEARDGAGPLYRRLGWTEVARRPGPDGEMLAEYALDHSRARR